MAGNLSDVAAVCARSSTGSKRRCIGRLQIYRMSAQTDRLLLLHNPTRSGHPSPGLRPPRRMRWGRGLQLATARGVRRFFCVDKNKQQASGSALADPPADGPLPSSLNTLGF